MLHKLIVANDLYTGIKEEWQEGEEWRGEGGERGEEREEKKVSSSSANNELHPRSC